MAEMDGAESLLQEPPMSPAVSPPPSPGQNTSDLAESTPKKQPAQDMEQAQNGVVSSATVAGDNMKALDSSSHGSPSSDPALQNAGNVGDGIMGPPPRPSSSYKASEGNAKAARSMQGPQSIPPRSGSGDHLNHAAPVQVGNEGAVLGPSQAAHTHPSILSDEAGPHEEHASDGVGGIDDDENATVPIVEYPWRDLQERYHDSMKAFQDEENHVYTEFDRLNQFFGVWATAGQTKEVERSFKRLKTRITYVQHAEEELEKKRSHYVMVVDAFRDALQLLGDK